MNPFLGVHSITSQNSPPAAFAQVRTYIAGLTGRAFLWWAASRDAVAPEFGAGRSPARLRAVRGRYCSPWGDGSARRRRTSRRGGEPTRRSPTSASRDADARRGDAGGRRRPAPTRTSPSRYAELPRRVAAAAAPGRAPASRRWSPRSASGGVAALAGRPGPRGRRRAAHRAGRPDHPRLAQRPRRPGARRAPPHARQADRRRPARPRHASGTRSRRACCSWCRSRSRPASPPARSTWSRCASACSATSSCARACFSWVPWAVVLRAATPPTSRTAAGAARPRAGRPRW